MRIASVKTDAVLPNSSLFDLLFKFLPPLHEKSLVAITSKVVSLSEGAVVPVGSIDKHELIHREASLYLPPEESAYGITLTVRNRILIPTAGIDESNGNGFYVLWPRDPQKSANLIRARLREHFGLRELGIIITDSTTTPMRRGTTGFCLAHSGFASLNNYIGEPDIFGHTMNVTMSNVADGLAAAAVVCMGEGSERTPLAVVEDCGFVAFRDEDPGEAELRELAIPLEEDLYAPMLKKVEWKRGGSK